MRAVLGLSKTSMRERLISAVENRSNPSHKNQGERFNPSVAEQGKLLERFQNRKKPLIGFFQGQQQPEAPQLSEMELQVLNEHRLQLQEDIEKRQAVEEKKLKGNKDAEALRHAKERLSISV